MNRKRTRSAPIKPLFHRGQWLFQLPDPFGAACLPLSARDLSERLGMPYRSALRIAKGERPLPAPALHYLQAVCFGLIADEDFQHRRFYVRDGELRCRDLPGRGLDPGALLELLALLPEYRRMLGEFQQAKEAAQAAAERYERLRVRYRDTVRELKALRRAARPSGPDMSNVVVFPGRPRRGPDDAA